jgi:hypothetical protein
LDGLTTACSAVASHPWHTAGALTATALTLGAFYASYKYSTLRSTATNHRFSKTNFIHQSWKRNKNDGMYRTHYLEPNAYNIEEEYIDGIIDGILDPLVLDMQIFGMSHNTDSRSEGDQTAFR